MDSKAGKLWYVLRTVSGKEQEAVGLLERAVEHELWTNCRILKKVKVFRSGGKLHLIEEVMFPGYLFIQTLHPEGLIDKLEKARKFPQIIGSLSAKMIPVEPSDLKFLQTVCGENLQRTMGITRIALSADNHIVSVEGVLRKYLNQIVKLNLRKRCAIVEVELFNRRQEVLFGLWLEKDQAG